MTFRYARGVPLETDAYISAFLPLERIRRRDLATFLWIDFEPPRARAAGFIATLREAAKRVSTARDLPRGVDHTRLGAGFRPRSRSERRCARLDVFICACVVGEIAELALLFLRLGATAFGGPAAHTAMMRREVVEQRGWLTDRELLDLMSATSFIPGPNSTELAIHIGHRRAGVPGLVVAGTCFIFPAALITLGFAWLYVRFGRMPQMAATLYGVKAVIVGVVVHALWGLGKSAVKTRELAVIGIAAVAVAMMGIGEIPVLMAAGVVHGIWGRGEREEGAERGAGDGEGKGKGKGQAIVWGVMPLGGAVAGVSVSGIFWIFVKIGAVLFGSGYVLLAFLRADLVVERGWLSEGQLLDAVAVGQITPGPVFTTATFIGYLLAGTSGAAAATAGIFLPAFFFVAISGPLVPKLRRSRRAGLFLDGLNVASLALMAVVTSSLGRAAIVDLWTVAFLGISAVVLLRTKINSAWLVLGGAVAGNLAFALR